MSKRKEPTGLGKNREMIRRTAMAGALFAIATMMILPALSFNGNVALAATSIKLKQTDFKFSVQAASPTLPADKGSYFAVVQLQTLKDNKPIEAPYDLEIQVASSDPAIVSAEAKVTMKQGESLVKIPLTTTEVSGSVSLSAQATGVTAGSADITTIKLDTLEPSTIAIYSVPSKLNPDPRYSGLLYIQLINSQGLPAFAKSSVPILLSSSDPSVVSVPDQISISAGARDLFINITPGSVIGVAKITASSPGFVHGETQVETAGSLAEKLVVEFGPTTIPAPIGFHSEGIVQLRNSDGSPIKAYQPVKVILKSSNTDQVKVPDSVEIQVGKSYAQFKVDSRGAVGTASVTAIATGYETGIGSIETVDSGLQSPAAIQMFAVPSVLPADESEHQSIIIQTLDSNGLPTGNQGKSFYYSLALTSSNPQFGTIGNVLNYESGYAIATFTTTQRLGKTTITASKEAYETVMIDMETKGPAPKALVVSQVPPIIQANKAEYQAVVVRLDDGKGNPVISSEDTIVTLTSSDHEIATVQGVITIPAGANFATGKIMTTIKPGTTTLTAAAPRLTSGTLQFKTIGDTSPFTLGLYAIPSTLPSDGQSYDAIVVQVQDLSGNPTRALSDIPVTLSSSSMTVGEVQKDLTIPKGASYAVASFTTAERKDKVSVNEGTTATVTPKDIEKFTVTATTQGYDSITTEMKVASQPLVVTVQKIAGVGFTTTPVIVDVFSGSLPVKDALVSVSGDHAEVRSVRTDENGHAEATYVPTLPGKNSIIVDVGKPGYIPYTKTQAVTIKQTIDLTIRGATEGANGVKPRNIDVKVTYTPPTGKEVSKDSPASKPIQLTNAKFGIYTISVPANINTADARYKFVRWSDGVTENPRSTNIVVDSDIVAIYSAQYMLHVNSKYGTVTGAKMYNEGEKATLSIEPTSVTGILSDNTFAGWSGDAVASTATASVVMNGPKTVNADWNENYLKMILIIGAAAGAGGFIFYKKKYKPAKKAAEEEDKAPDLDWFKG